MSVESATFIGQLSPNNPPFGDPLSEGDDHLRLLKHVLQNTFPSLTAPVSFATLGISIASAVDLADFLTKTALLADQTTVDAGTDNQKFVSSLTFQTGITNRFATEAEAEAGADATKLMNPLRVAQAIAALAPSPSSFTNVSADTVASVSNRTLRYTAGGKLATIPITSGFLQRILNAAASGDVTITPASGTIDGLATRKARPTDRVLVQGDGTNLYTVEGDYSFDSGEQAIAAGAEYSATHGLGVQPYSAEVRGVCQSTDGNFVTGNVIWLAPWNTGTGFSTHRGFSLQVDATNVKLRMGTGGLAYINPTTGAESNLDVSKWHFIVHLRAR